MSLAKSEKSGRETNYSRLVQVAAHPDWAGPEPELLPRALHRLTDMKIRFSKRTVKDVGFRGFNQNWRLPVLGNPHMVLTKSTAHQSLWAVHALANKETPSI